MRRAEARRLHRWSTCRQFVAPLDTRRAEGADALGLANLNACLLLRKLIGYHLALELAIAGLNGGRVDESDGLMQVYVAMARGGLSAYSGPSSQ
jgi:hypothetical protein